MRSSLVFVFLVLALCISFGQSKTMWGARRKKDSEEKQKAQPRASLERAKRTALGRRRASDRDPLAQDSVFSSGGDLDLHSLLAAMDQHLDRLEAVLRSDAFRDNFSPTALRTLLENAKIPGLEDALQSFRVEDVDEFAEQALQALRALRENKRELAESLSSPAFLESLLLQLPAEYADVARAFLSGETDRAQAALLRALPVEMRVAARAALRGDTSLLKDAFLNSDLFAELDPQLKKIVELAMDPESSSDVLNEVNGLLGDPEKLKQTMLEVVDSPEVLEALEALQIPKETLQAFVDELESAGKEKSKGFAAA